MEGKEEKKQSLLESLKLGKNVEDQLRQSFKTSKPKTSLVCF